MVLGRIKTDMRIYSLTIYDIYLSITLYKNENNNIDQLIVGKGTPRNLE